MKKFLLLVSSTLHTQQSWRLNWKLFVKYIRHLPQRLVLSINWKKKLKTRVSGMILCDLWLHRNYKGHKAIRACLFTASWVENIIYFSPLEKKSYVFYIPGSPSAYLRMQELLCFLHQDDRKFSEACSLAFDTRVDSSVSIKYLFVWNQGFLHVF